MQKNEYLCESNINHNRQWCLYEATDGQSIIVEIFFVVCIAIIGIVIIKNIFRLVFRQNLGKEYIVVNVILALWMFTMLLKMLMNIFIFYIYMVSDQKQSDYEPKSNETIVIASIIFKFFDSLSTFWLLCLMIMIPYKWINKILLSVNETQQQILTDSQRLKIDRYFKVLKGIHFYYKYLRNLIVLFFLSQIYMKYFTSLTCAPLAAKYIFTVQTVFVLFFYIFCNRVAVFIRQNQIIKVLPSDYRRIMLQFFLLILVLVSRIVIIVYFQFIAPTIVSPQNHYQPDTTCLDHNLGHKRSSVYFLASYFAFTHILPACVILYIYRPSQEGKEVYDRVVSLSFQNNLSDSIVMQSDQDSDWSGKQITYSGNKKRRGSHEQEDDRRETLI